MAKNLHIRLTGRAERLVERLVREGLNERDVIAKALWILDLAVTSNRVALLRSNYRDIKAENIESLLVLREPEFCEIIDGSLLRGSSTSESSNSSNSAV